MENWAAYTRPPQMIADLSVACSGAGEFSGHAEGFRGRRLRTHAAVVVSEGSGWFSSAATGNVALTAPVLMWLRPGVEHGYGPTVGGWKEHWILYSGSTTRLFDEVAARARALPIRALDALPGALGDVFARLRIALAGSDILDALRASAVCYEWLTELSSASPDQDAPDLIDAFTRDCADLVPMASRARRLGVDLPTLRAATIAATGLTPLQLLIEARLSRAQSLLAETDLDMSAIASRVGFDDPAYFSRQFARRRGLSPTAFRQEQRRASGEVPPLSDA
ncbi:helix-turn-helix domain-containing protein [Microbacterium sp. 179-I 3D3 NHS]|uniref:helix-turn-helix domain-containing protein n=1 Tax=unclassified Microbacterium TaxID=2609290 RepID=UPI00399F88E4